MTQTLFDYWFRQFDFPDENSKLYKSTGGEMVYNEVIGMEIPKTWDVINMHDLIQVKDGTHDSPKAQDKGFHLITSKHLKDCGIDLENANLIRQLIMRQLIKEVG